MQIYVDDIPIEVVRKKVKNINLRVRPDGTVVISAPRLTPILEIKHVAHAHEDWIRKRLAKVQAKGQKTAAEPVEGGIITLWGEQYRVQEKSATRNGITLKDGVAYLNVKQGSTAADREAYLKEWYRAQLKKRVAERLPYWEEKTGLHCNEWRIRDMTSRWGTCNTRDRRVWLNLQLAKYPPECLDYVILHELAHLKERSHGPAFKAVLNQYMPDWQRIRKQLNG